MKRGLLAGVSLAIVVLAATALAGGGGPRTKLISKTSSGEPATGGSSISDEMTPNGRFVVFSSDATNLPGGGTDRQAFVRDRRRGKTRLISKTSGGVPGDDGSENPSISADGRLVAFDSNADNLPGPDDDRQVFLHDRETGRTKLVSKTSSGEPADGSSAEAAISANGRFVAFHSDSTNLPGAGLQVYVRNLRTGRTKLVSKTNGGAPADGESREPSVSRNGRRITFESLAPNLGADPLLRVYVRDLRKGKTRQVSRNSAGDPADGGSDEALISLSGNVVVFHSSASNLPGGGAGLQVYARYLRRGKTRLVSKTSDGEPSSGGDGSEDPSISPDERFVIFESEAANLSPEATGIPQIYVRDLERRRTRLVSRANNGEPGDDASNIDRMGRYISRDGRFVLFHSVAANFPSSVGPDDRQVYIRGPFG